MFTLRHGLTWIVLVWAVSALGDIPKSSFFLQESGPTFSTTWTRAADEALPAELKSKDLSFQQKTNLLRQESQRGNHVAQGLWGFVLVVQGQSTNESQMGLQLLRTSAEKGFMGAIINLALLYAQGRYVPTNHNEAFHWYSLAGEQGIPEAQFSVGRCYVRGLGTVRDLTMAARYFRLSAQQTNYAAMRNLGSLLGNGFGGVAKDIEEAKYWFQRGAKEAGDRRAMYNLALLLGMDTNRMAETLQWHKKSAELGDPLACYALGSFYRYGQLGLETNIAISRDWQLKAATLGATAAQFEIGVAYETGTGVATNLETSLGWFHKAAAKSHPNALYALARYYKGNPASVVLANNYLLRSAQGGHRDGQLQYAVACFRGDAGPIDFETGKQWLAKSVESGWGPAEYYLFSLYFNGVAPAAGCPAYPKDVPGSIKWLRRAAEHGNLQAQTILGVMLIQGKDVQQDKVEAEKLLRNAARYGFAEAENDLGYSIGSGMTGTTDLVEAAMWCKLAVKGSTDARVLQPAKVNLSNALSRLTPEQQLEVSRRVEEFRPLPDPQIDPLTKGWEENPAYEPEDRHD